MTPFDQFRLWFDGLDEDLQHAIGFTLVPVLVNDLRAKSRDDGVPVPA